MSSLPVHRQTDRGGGTKPQTPNSISNNFSSALKKSSSGKENPRLALRSQKPTMRSLPRVEKSAGENRDSRVRRSTSSAPRGRSQSPSEFIRVFSDVKKDKVARVTVEKKGSRDFNMKKTELGSNEKRRFSDFKENNAIGVKMEKKCEKEMNLSGVKVLRSSCEKDVYLTSTLGKRNGVISVNGSNEKRHEKGCPKSGSKVEISDTDVSFKHYDKIEKIGACVDLDLKESGQKSISDSKVLETSKGKGVNEEVSSTRVGINYPSKLHEKLTFLEGKVKRIASDIKRTKEMLDMNNPDATKVILSDIQEKISGIEKAMGNVAGDSEGKIAGVKYVGNDNSGSNIVEKSKCQRMESVNSLRSELKSEELEARLFPHHKLLRNRISLKSSSGSSGSLQPNTAGPSNNLKVEKLLSPIEDNPIALEFLASLNKDQSAVTFTDGQGGLDLECCEVLETDEAANSGEQGLSNVFNGKRDADLILTTDERFDEFEDQENVPGNITGKETEDSCIYQLNEVGLKTSTGGWFVSEGESVLLAHDDGSCSFYDIANCEVHNLVCV